MNSKGIKRQLIFVLIIFSVFLFGCKEKQQETKTTNEFDIRIATNLVDSYMQYLINSNVESAKELYSKRLSKEIIKKENEDIKVKGYSIDEMNEFGDSALFTNKVVSVNNKEPYTSVEEYKIKIIKEDNDYKLDEINISMDKEAFVKKNRIRYRNKNNVKTELIIKPTAIPDYAYSKDDKAKTERIRVPKNKIGPMSLAYSENFIAISTYDKDSYVGIITIDESKAVQGGKEEGQGEQQGNGGATSQGGEDILEEMGERPIGKEISSLDLLKGSKIDFMIFSSDEKFISIQYETSDNSKNVRVYKIDGCDIIPFKMEDKYPLNKVNITFSSFTMDSMIFNVSSKEKDSKNLSKFIGKWELSLKDFKVKKI